MTNKKGIIFLVLFTVMLHAAAQNIPIPLYPDGVPNSKLAPADYKEKLDSNKVYMVTEPTIIPYFPPKEKATGSAVIICPGGAYVFLSIVYEGYDVAKMFNDIGVAAFVLKYRLPSNKIMENRSIGPLQDAQRAIQLVRQNAKEWGIDTAKVGIMGFSAGGHLASTAGTHFNEVVISNPNNISVRPNFMMLIYPVIDLGEFAHKGSKDKLIGSNATQEQIDAYSNQKQVTGKTPITFLVHAGNDLHVPVQNSLLFYEALLKAGVKAEMHIYQAGSHGFGLNNSSTPDKWFDRCKNFLQQNKFL